MRLLALDEVERVRDHVDLGLRLPPSAVTCAADLAANTTTACAQQRTSV
jgi:hypothetical protein